MHPDLEKLIQLQEAELQIKNYSDRIEQLPGHLAALEEKLSGALQSLSRSQERLAKLALEKRKLEGVIQDFEQKNSKYREQLIDVKTNEQQGRAKAEKKCRPGAFTFLNRLGADLDPMIDQKGFQTRVYEGGQRGREGTHPPPR